MKDKTNSKRERKEIKGTTLAILTAMISGLAIPINKIFVVSMDPLIFTALRSLLIGIFFFILLSFKWNFSFKEFRKIKWKYLFAIAFIGGSLAFLFFFTGLKLTTSGRASFLHKTLPLYVLLLASVFLKEKITKKQLFSIFLMFFGTILIYEAEITPSELWINPKLGDFLVVFATFLWAVENTIAKKAMIKGENNFVVSFARMFFGGLIIFSLILILGKTDLLFSIKSEQLLNIFISTFILTLYVTFWYWSISYINVSKASSLLLLSPVISLIFGYVLFKEPIPLIQIIGSAFILLGAYFVSKIRSEFA